MAEKEVLLTKEGLAQLEEELDNLKNVKRREVAGRIKQAIEFGDISENSEYEDAKNEQAMIEGQIVELEGKIRNARVIETTTDMNVVTIGSTVKLLNLDKNMEMEYTIDMNANFLSENTITIHWERQEPQENTKGTK